jgi:hypothetical protein
MFTQAANFFSTTLLAILRASCSDPQVTSTMWNFLVLAIFPFRLAEIITKMLS